MSKDFTADNILHMELSSSIFQAEQTAKKINMLISDVLEDFFNTCGQNSQGMGEQAYRKFDRGRLKTDIAMCLSSELIERFTRVWEILDGQEAQHDDQIS